jgi:AGZA family xanthine/uracil permease-like MFS transporter
LTRQRNTWGEFSAFLALFIDNLGVLVFLSAILIFTYKFPSDIIFFRMIPGTALGVLFGDLVYSWLALRLARKTGRSDVTAMPLGLDTPSTIGLAFTVLGPAYAASGDAVLAWQIGTATLFIIGLVKIITSFLGGWVQRIVPTAGLMGSLAGIGLLLLGFLPMIEIFNSSIAGMVALGLVFYVLVGRMELPGPLPGVLLAVLCGTGLHLLLGYSGLLPEFHRPVFEITPALPVFSTDFFSALPASIKYLPIAIPFALLTIIGGINNTESARLAGDAYRARDILLTEAASTIIAAFFGGVAQTTPYIGHPAYKKMGATWRYTLAAGLLIGLGASAGIISCIMTIIPKAALAPIFIFIGFEIVRQAYAAVPADHSPAVTFAFFPVIANLVMIFLNQFITPDAVPERLQVVYLSLTVVSNGFILTSILWGGMLACLIDKRPRRAAVYAAACSGFTLFGLMHSAAPTGEVYLPWHAPGTYPFSIASAYILLACVCLLPAKAPSGTV